MRKIYKYMPLSTLDKFLDDPCLRITPGWCQNDPFEFIYSIDDLTRLIEISSNSDFGRQIKEFTNLHGIVSFSSEKADMLMWAHYADKHQGAVVEFSVDNESPHFLFHSGFSALYPKENFLFDNVEYVERRGYDFNDENPRLDSVINHYFFKKDVQWSNECECRFVLYIGHVNKIILNYDGFKKTKAIFGGDIKIDCIKSRNSYEIDPLSIEYIKVTCWDKLIHLWNCSENNDIMFFARVDTRNIASIYFGCMSNHLILKKKIKSKLDHSRSLTHKFHNDFTSEVNNIYKAKIDEVEFKIRFDLLETKDFSSSRKGRHK